MSTEQSKVFNDGTIPGLPGGPKSRETETFKVSPDSLPADAKKEAWDAIIAAYDIHYRADDGIFALETKVEAARQTVSEIVMEHIIRAAVRVAGNSLAVAHGVAMALKKYAETELKKRDKLEHNRELPMADLLPAWTNACSKGLRSLGKGIDPNALDPVSNQPVFDSLNKYAEASNPPPDANTDGQTKKGSVLQIVAKGLTPKLASAMQILSENLSRLSNPEQDIEADFVEKFANGVATRHTEYVKAHPVTETEATATATGPGAEPAKAPTVPATPMSNAQKRQEQKRGGSR